MKALHYRPELDNDGGFFIVTGDDAKQGLLMLIAGIVVMAISYSLTTLIEKKYGEPRKGLLQVTYNILLIIGYLSFIFVFCTAFFIWWISLIAFVIIIICVAFYKHYKGED